MRKLLNVLYVTTPDSHLSRDGENVVVKVKGCERARFPVHTLEGIVCFGYLGATPALMDLCCDRGVSISYVSEFGRFLARVSGPVNGNIMLRREQYRIADTPSRRASIARNAVLGKILNCRTVLLRFLRDHGAVDRPMVVDACDALLSLGRAVEINGDVDSIRGIEGEAARRYFEVFNALITVDSDRLSVTGRSRRPPRDPVNALLSFLYTLLASECTSALETVGLDPQAGFLHTDRSGRPGLALDLMEELRPYLADRMALTLINSRQVSEDGFEIRESGAVLMDEATRKTVITAWHKRKQEDTTHPYLGEKIKIGLVPYAQALLLARHIRGDLDGYPPFFTR